MAVVVPNVELITKWSNENGLAGKNVKELCEEQAMVKMIRSEMGRIGAKEGLKGYEVTGFYSFVLQNGVRV